MLEGLYKPKATSVRCNTSKATVEEIVKSLEYQGTTVEKSKLYDKALKISGYDKLENLDVFNINEQKEQMNAIVLIIAIFAYGFIIVISLIGITNVFNTINTNMRLRSKEFAMLKSIGMTKKEFNRMIRLESLFYGLKSLLIGVPLGLLGGYAIFKATGNTIMLNYSFPTMAVLISIVFVFFVVWLIMKISISKVNKQNIIETIRNDNI